MHDRKPSFRVALLAVFLAVVVVLLGAFTRLQEAGLGCPDWPTCYGHFWVPNTDAEIHAANQAFSHAPVETDKTWPEQIHRIFAAGLGVLAIVLVVLAIKHRRCPEQPIRLPLFLLCFIVLQGLFGMWTVTLLLWPQVVTAHLLGGFTMLSLLWLLLQRLANVRWVLKPAEIERLLRVRSLALLTLFVVIAQIFLGGWTSSNYAALACPDFPTCHGVWVPHMDLQQGFNVFQHIGPNYLGGQLESDARTAIHYVHRLGAVVTTLVVLSLSTALWRTAVLLAKRMAMVLVAVLFLQVALGISNVIFALPLMVAVAHNAVGALLLLTTVTLNHRLYTVRQEV